MVKYLIKNQLVKGMIISCLHDTDMVVVMQEDK